MAMSVKKMARGICLVLLCLCNAEGALKIQDLTHTFDNTTLHWPTIAASNRFRFTQKVTVGFGATYYGMNYFCAAEHGGTHMDAPSHFVQGKMSADQVPLSKLIGKVAVIDVTTESKNNSDYLIGPPDFQRYEKKHGRIPDESIILLNTGMYFAFALHYLFRDFVQCLLSRDRPRGSLKVDERLLRA